jgi:hypothetical protein
VAYATLADLKARAGALAQAWYDGSDPSDTDIQVLLDQVSDELDVFYGGAGYDVPLQDPIAQRGLVSINADKALLLALDATYPGDASNVKDLRASILARVAVYDAAIATGDAAILMYLGQSAAGQQEAGASDFWTEDGAEDYWWSTWGARLASWPWMTDQWGIPISQGPGFRKGMSL